MSAVEVRSHRGRIIWGPFDAISPHEIDQAEEAIGRTLPVDYREFIQLANGGTLPYAVRLPPHGAEGELIEFSRLARVAGNFSLAEAWTNFGTTVFAEHLPPELLEVAQDGGGSTLFLDLREESFGSVWAFVFGLPEWTGSSRSNMGGLVAPSWSAYLDMLTLDRDYAQEVWKEAQTHPDAAWTAAVVAWLDSGFPEWRTESWASS